MSYIQSLTSGQLSNMNAIVVALTQKGIWNQFSQAAALAVASKECEFKLYNESSYANTPNDRIRAIFGYHFIGVTDDQLNIIKASDKLFFNKVYGNMYGNGPDNAYMYIGRGFNQITFLGNYKAIGEQLGVDLVNNPQLLDTPSIAANALVQYFIDRFHSITSQAISDIHTNNINGFTNINDALLGIYHANAGWGNPVFPDTTGGYTKALSRVAEFYNYLTPTSA